MLAIITFSGTAAAQSVRIDVDYKDLSAIWLSDLSANTRAALNMKDGFVSLPTVESRSGQTATIEYIGQIVFLHANKPESVDCGIMLKLHTKLEDGRIRVSGTSMLRRSNQNGARKHVINPTFHSKQTFIDGTYDNGKLVKIPVDLDDPAGEQLLLTFTLLKGDGNPAK